MRLFAVLCAIAGLGASSAYAQDATDAQRLNAAAFAHHSIKNTWDAPATVYGQVKVGRYAVEPSYSVERTAESWRVPESGQDVTTSQLEFRAYVADHPFVKWGASALMRSGKHDEANPHDPSALSAHLGGEPDRHDYKFHLNFAFW